MDALRRALLSGVTYGPRFIRHFQHRRRAGYTLGHAVRSTRRRMRDPLR